MRRNRININLIETTHSDFELMCELRTTPDFENELREEADTNGIFEFKNGVAQAKVAPMLYINGGQKNGGYFPLVSSSQQYIYGFLEDGTYVRLNKYTSSNRRLALPGSSATNYISYETDFSRTSFAKEELADDVWITINSLSELASFIIPKELENVETLNNVTKRIVELPAFDLFLKVLYTQKKTMTSYNVNVNVALEVKPHDGEKEIDILNFVKKFESFISVINDSQMDITAIKFFKNKRCTKLRLPYSTVTEENSTKDFSRLCQISRLNFGYYQENLSDIFKVINDQDIKLNRLVSNYMYNINHELNIDSSLLNYVNSIEFYLRAEKYQNGKNIESLYNKIKCFIERLPNELYCIFFNESIGPKNTKEISFIKTIVNTRNYLVHGKGEDSAFLLSNFQEKTDYVEFLRHLIRVKILYRYGIPKKIIAQEYKLTWGSAYFHNLISLKNQNGE